MTRIPAPRSHTSSVTHFDEAPSREFSIGHIGGRWTGLGEAAGGRWTGLGEAAGCRNVGVRRLELGEGAWSTPVHEHGREEEIFYVLGGRGISWHAGNAAEVGPGDCIVYRAHRGAHSLHALERLDVLAFGPREYDETVSFPRLGMSLVGGRFVDSVPASIDGVPLQFVRESEIGPPELPAEPGPRPPSIVNLDSVTPEPLERPRVVRTRRNLARAAGSVTTGLQHVEVAPGKESSAMHCHSLEEEIFVVLDGDGVVMLGEEAVPVRPGSVVSRPAGTGIAHVFRAGDDGLAYLAYGTREPGDVCWYPRSSKLFFRGVGVVVRVEPLDYWDGED